MEGTRNNLRKVRGSRDRAMVTTAATAATVTEPTVTEPIGTTAKVTEETEEVIADEEIHGTSVDLLKVNRKLLQTALLNRPWESIHGMTDCICEVDNAQMISTLNPFRQFGNDEMVG